MVSLSPVGRLFHTRDESNEGGLMTGAAAVGLKGEEQKRKDAALGGIWC